MEELIKLIDRITILGLKPNVELDNKTLFLKQHLVKLYSMFLDNEFVMDSEFEEPLYNFNYEEIRKNVGQNFPDFGYYNSISDVNNIEEVQVPVIGDSVDDLTDIVKDLLEVKCIYENLNEKNAAWHLDWIIRSHSEQHIVDLLKYLKNIENRNIL
ncbi:hypothetical protein LVD15_00205 [Fulvivirga maritima]|uniref:hypothetical protein n=1 Tax=Fulvivirga maritima TaxID=2904247 RepID=UPI001F42DB72|nr:hypothetical protein [Fulvivirga maritima]UII26893.1 hypothetical protein LVD15_00205 [Fulvivirga maritima]